MSAAFFDLDNTLVRGSALFIVIRHLAEQGTVRRKHLAQAAVTHALYRATARENGVAAAGSRSLDLAAGVLVSAFEEWATAALDSAFPQSLYPGSVQLLRAHQEAGHRTYIASAAPLEVALIAARLLGCDGAVGTIASRRDGMFTGTLDTPVLRGAVKATAVAGLADREGIDLGSASAYSDSHNDLPMLRLVGDPHAVNPDGRLRRVARDEAWPVHDVSMRKTAVRASFATVAILGACAVGVAGAAIARPRDSR